MRDLPPGYKRWPCGHQTKQNPGVTACPICGTRAEPERIESKTDTVRIALPVPTNALYGNSSGLGKGRKRTERYQAWIDAHVGPVFAALGRFPTPVHLVLTIMGGKGFDPSKSDLDNRAKASLDLLVHAGVIPDDTVDHVGGLEIRYVPAGDRPEPAYATIRLIPMAGKR